ncbi:hypothetical protein AAY473_037180, partial [Plecturocebus cupreus]
MTLSLALSPRLCIGVISAHCNICLWVQAILLPQSPKRRKKEEEEEEEEESKRKKKEEEEYEERKRKL